MKKNIYRTVLIFGLLFTFLTISPTHKRVVAAQDPDPLPGEHCWSLRPYIDTLRVTVEKMENSYIFYGRWEAERLYSIAIVGSIVRDDVDGRLDFMFTGSDQLDLGYIWHFHAKMRSDGTGNWTFSRDDDFTNSGTLVYVKDCEFDRAASGPTANDPY